MSAQPRPSRETRERKGAGLNAGLDYRRVREATQALCATLAPEDTVVQSMPDASPAKWHLAHTTWFFEQFLLTHFDPGYRRFHDGWDFLFNSYYQTVIPIQRVQPTFALDGVPAFRQPKGRIAVAAIVDEFTKLGVGHAAVGDRVRLQ